jgi:hypothetical protein
MRLGAAIRDRSGPGRAWRSLSPPVMPATGKAVRDYRECERQLLFEMIVEDEQRPLRPPARLRRRERSPLQSRLPDQARLHLPSPLWSKADSHWPAPHPGTSEAIGQVFAAEGIGRRRAASYRFRRWGTACPCATGTYLARALKPEGHCPDPTPQTRGHQRPFGHRTRIGDCCPTRSFRWASSVSQFNDRELLPDRSMVLATIRMHLSAPPISEFPRKRTFAAGA